MMQRPAPADIEHTLRCYPPEHNFAVGILWREIEALRAENALLSSAKSFMEEIEAHKEREREATDTWRRLFAWWRSQR